MNRTAVRSRCSREASATANRRTAASSSRPRSGLRGRGQRLQRPAQPVIVSSAAGTPSSSVTAAEDAHPAMSYSGAGEHSRRGQHRDHLPVPGQGPAPAREHPVHDPGHVQAAGSAPRPAAGPTCRRVPGGGWCSRASPAASCSSCPPAPAHPAGPGLPQRAGAPGRPRAGPRPAPGTKLRPPRRTVFTRIQVATTQGTRRRSRRHAGHRPATAPVAQHRDSPPHWTPPETARQNSKS